VTTGADLPGVLAAAALIEAELGERLPAQLGRAGIWPATGP
jgi:hydroxymethylglutaryl-CoA lyase